MASIATKRKVLMLHGFTQSGQLFRSKTGGLRKNLTKLGFELYYPTAPHLVTKALLKRLYGTSENIDGDPLKSSLDLASKFGSSNSTDEIYGWYLKEDPHSASFDIETSTLTLLHDFVVENGPFDGLIGFSQGAGFGGYLLTNFNELLNLTKQEQPDFQFFISYSGFKLDDIKYQEAYTRSPISIPSLHVQGELDTVVSEIRVMSLFNACEGGKRTLLKHPGGHFVPNSKHFTVQVCNWIQTTTGNYTNTVDNASAKDVPKESMEPTFDDSFLDAIDSMGKI